MWKTLKRISISLAATATLLIPTTAYAISPTDILPKGTDLVADFYPENLDSSLKVYYDAMIDELGAISSYATSDENLLALDDYLTGRLADAPLTVSYNLDGMYSYESYIFIEMSDSSYSTNVKNTLSDYEAMDVDGYDLYDFTSELGIAFTYIEDEFVMAEDVASLVSLINNYTCEESDVVCTYLSDDSDYNDIANNSLSDSVLDLYIDFSFMSSLGLEADYIFESAGYSVSTPENRVKLRVHTNNDTYRLQELGIDELDASELTLQDLMPDSKPILYLGASDAAYSIASIKSMPDYEDILAELNRELGIDLESIFSLAENEFALLVENNKGLLPDITFMLETGENETSIKASLDTVVASFWSTLQQNADKIMGNALIFEDTDGKLAVTRDTVVIGGGTMDQFNFAYTTNPSNNPYQIRLDEYLNFTVTIGTTHDGTLLISTNKDIKEKYGEGLSNSTINNLISGSTNAFYLNPAELNNYLGNAIGLISKAARGDVFDGSSIITVLNQIFAPWGLITSEGTASMEYSSATIEINVDMAQMIADYNMIDLVDADANIEVIDESSTDFEDVGGAEWYANDVYYLTTMDVINGHPDGTFKPGDTINKAELITLIVNILQEEGYISGSLYWAPYSNLDETFSDVDPTAWYTPALYEAYTSGIIDGENGLLKPDQPLTRQEVAEIIANTIEVYGISAEKVNMGFPSYSDMAAGTPTYGAVSTLYQYGIMTGTAAGTFEPDRSINRAESARVLKNLMDLL